MIHVLRDLVIGTVIIVALFYGFLVSSVPHAEAGEGQRCGEASWYGDAHQGRLMANGRPFNMNALTAASWDYPFGTVLIVRNVQNGKSVRIVVTDRGPARRLHRIIDLSKAAAARIGLIPAGVGTVCVERL